MKIFWRLFSVVWCNWMTIDPRSTLVILLLRTQNTGKHARTPAHSGPPNTKTSCILKTKISWFDLFSIKMCENSQAIRGKRLRLVFHEFSESYLGGAAGLSWFICSFNFAFGGGQCCLLVSDTNTYNVAVTMLRIQMLTVGIWGMKFLGLIQR